MSSRASRSTLLRLLLVVGAPAAAVAAFGACDDGPSSDPSGLQGGVGGVAGAADSETAGPGGSPTSSSIGGTAGTAGTSLGANGGAAGNTSTITMPDLPPIPAGTAGSSTGYPECGPDQSTPGGFGYHGSCCIDVVCRAPEADGRCPAPEEVRRGTGSGTCGCDATTGPYAPGVGQEADVAEGKACCYLAGIITCDGRPLLVAGLARVAALAAAPDDARRWASGLAWVG
jgi:hypothetical protein